jgi:hypothetical protein
MSLAFIFAIHLIIENRPQAERALQPGLASKLLITQRFGLTNLRAFFLDRFCRLMSESVWLNKKAPWL